MGSVETGWGKFEKGGLSSALRVTSPYGKGEPMREWIEEQKDLPWSRGLRLAHHLP